MERIRDSCYGNVPLPLQAMLGMALCHTEVSACAICHHKSLPQGGFHRWACHPGGKFLSLICASR